LLGEHNIIVYKDVAINHADKSIPVAHQFIKEITSIIAPQDYKDRPNEFIEMVMAIMSYTSASLLVALYDMFPPLSIETFKKGFDKSIESALKLQMKNRV
jgi:hypothetical protein